MSRATDATNNPCEFSTPGEFGVVPKQFPYFAGSLAAQSLDDRTYFRNVRSLRPAVVKNVHSSPTRKRSRLPTYADPPCACHMGEEVF
jgi:hypothetical protein